MRDVGDVRSRQTRTGWGKYLVQVVRPVEAASKDQVLSACRVSNGVDKRLHCCLPATSICTVGLIVDFENYATFSLVLGRDLLPESRGVAVWQTRLAALEPV